MKNKHNLPKILIINILISILLISTLLIIKTILTPKSAPPVNNPLLITLSSDYCPIYEQKGTLFFKYVPNSYCLQNLSKNNKLIKTYKENIDENGFRRTINNPHPKNKSIIFFGDSFTYGYGLEDQETFPSQIAKLSNYKVYNAGISGGGVQHMLLHLQDPEFTKKIPQADYIIYTFIPEHIGRLYGPPHRISNLYYPKFKLKNDKLKYIPPSIIFINYPFTRNLYTKIENINEEYKNRNIENQASVNLYIAILKESQRLSKIKYPNAKFIVFDMNNAKNIDKQLKNNGINVIMLKDVIQEEDIGKYFIIEGHPTGEFWQKICPAFIKKFNIK